MYYCHTRYYSPELCRWISPDSVSYLDTKSINGMNLYKYSIDFNTTKLNLLWNKSNEKIFHRAYSKNIDISYKESINYKEFFISLIPLLGELMIVSLKDWFANLFKIQNEIDEVEDSLVENPAISEPTLDDKENNRIIGNIKENQDLIKALINSSSNGSPNIAGIVEAALNADLKGAFGGKIDERNKTAEQYLIYDDLW